MCSSSETLVLYSVLPWTWPSALADSELVTMLLPLSIWLHSCVSDGCLLTWPRLWPVSSSMLSCSEAVCFVLTFPLIISSVFKDNLLFNLLSDLPSDLKTLRRSVVGLLLPIWSSDSGVLCASSPNSEKSADDLLLLSFSSFPVDFKPARIFTYMTSGDWLVFKSYLLASISSRLDLPVFRKCAFTFSYSRSVDDFPPETLFCKVTFPTTREVKLSVFVSVVFSILFTFLRFDLICK